MKTRHLVRIANQRLRTEEVLRLISIKTEGFLMVLSKTEEREQNGFSNTPQPIRDDWGASILGPGPFREWLSVLVPSLAWVQPCLLVLHV